MEGSVLHRRRVAITGGTGFVGRHLADALLADGCEVVLVARGRDRRDEAITRRLGVRFVQADLRDARQLAEAFRGCQAVAHLAGINRELGRQTYQRVHVEGTRNVVAACKAANVQKIVLLSFLRARPNCGSKYHESKYAAEELVRGSGLDFTVLKCGVIYGRGDHMLDHLSHALHSFPVFALVGMRDQPVRPVAVEDVACILQAVLTEGRMSHRTIAVMGPERMLLGEAVRRVAEAVDKHPVIVPAPVAAHRAFAWLMEQTMTIPLVAQAQVRILSEGIVEPLPPCDEPPADLRPATFFTQQQLRNRLPQPGGFGWHDCRWTGQTA